MTRRHSASVMIVVGLLYSQGSAAADREAQAQTVRDIRNIGTALFSWLTDQVGFAPWTPSPISAQTTIDFADYPAISHAELEDLLVPIYMQSVPELDGWGHPYDFRLNAENILSEHIMAVRSPGRDGVFSGDSYLVSPFEHDLFDQDIAWADGFFVRWPEEVEGLAFYTVVPCRVLDTRSGPPLQAAASFTVAGTCGIPASAKAVALNVTVTQPSGAGYVTLFPGGLAIPSTSTVHFAAGQVRSSSALLLLGEGSLGAWASVDGGGHVHLIVDVSGWFE